MVLSFSSSANAACPPGFSPVLKKIVQQVNPSCKIVISYCISDAPGGLGTYEVYISEISYFGNCVIPTDPPSFPPVDWNFVLATIILDNPAKYQIGLCPGEIQVRMFNGGCFRHIQGFKMDENGEIYWCDYFEPCDMEGLASCRQYFTACLQFTQGQYVVVVTAGPVQTLFTCVDPYGDCQRLCE
jgi:hypothetical protein